MDDVLYADAVDDDTVRVDLDGDRHHLSRTVAKQLSRDLDAAITEQRSEPDEVKSEDEPEPEPSSEIVQVLTTVDMVGQAIAEQVDQRFDSLEEVAEATDEELEAVKGLDLSAR